MENSTNRTSYRSLGLYIILIIFMTGCSGSRQSSFYVLRPASNAEANGEVMPAADSLAIGIGPVKIPQYLDRPQLITLDSRNSLHVAEYNYWTGPLKDQVPRVIMENISTFLNTDRVWIFPWRSTTPLDFQITVDLIRMDPTARGNIDFKARWSVLTDRGRKTLSVKKTQILIPVDPGNYGNIADASGRAIAKMCSEIALELKNLSN